MQLKVQEERISDEVTSKEKVSLQLASKTTEKVHIKLTPEEEEKSVRLSSSQETIKVTAQEEAFQK